MVLLISNSATVADDPQDNTAEMYQQVQERNCKKRQHDDDNDDTNARQSSVELQDYSLDEGYDTGSVEERSSEYKNKSKKRKFN